MMKKLYLSLLALFLTVATANAAGLYHLSGGEKVEVQSVNIMSAGEAVPVTPEYSSGGSWHELLQAEQTPWRLIVGTISQSNLVGNPSTAVNSGTIPTVTIAGIELHTNGNYTNPLAEPTGNNDSPFNYSGQADGFEAGSIWPALVNQYYARTGQKIIVLSLGINGTRTDQWINGHAASAKAKIDAALSQLIDDGYDFVWEDIVCIIGESDNAAGFSEATHHANMTTLFNYFINQYPDRELHFTLGSPFAGTVFGIPYATMAQFDLAEERDDVSMGSTYQYTSPGTYHYIQSQLNTVGTAIANSIAGRQ